MSTKTLIYLGLFIGSTIGSYVPVLFGASLLSGWSIIGSGIGALLGVWAGYKLGNEYLGF